MLFDARVAQQSLESAQDARASYDRLTGALDRFNEGSDDENNENSRRDRKEREKRWNLRWQTHCSLCFDISYHLGFVYLRLGRIAFAIAEAEAALGFAAVSEVSDGRGEGGREGGRVVGLEVHSYLPPKTPTT